MKLGLYTFRMLLHEDDGENIIEKARCLIDVHKLVGPTLEGKRVHEYINTKEF